MSFLKVNLFIVSTLLLLMGVTFLFPNDKVDIAGYEVKYPSFDKFWNQKKVEHKDISDVTDNFNEDEIKVNTECDTCDGGQFTVIETKPLKKTTISKTPIIIPDGLKGKWSRMFKDFANAKNNKVRIIHYGDSQLEGDRITGYLREKFQASYGGNGPGFVPLMPVYSQIAVNIKPEGDWKRYAIFDKTQSKTEDKRYGLWMSYTTMDKIVLPDSLKDSTKTDIVQGSYKVAISASGRAFSHARSFSELNLHYGDVVGDLTIEITQAGSPIYSSKLDTGTYYKSLKVPLTGTKDILLNFKGPGNAKFFGLTFEKGNGIYMDNVAMRGSSGTIFTKVNGTLFSQMAAKRNPSLVIMQFGGNSVPHIENSKAATRYANWMVSQINRVKRACPNACILFIGPSDMSTLIEEEYQSYPYLQEVIDALKAMCQRQNVAYFDLCKTMGGLNSMPTWVEKGLAAKDYTHFAPAGTRIVSELLFKALIESKNP